jgi:hypothetical protein
MTQTLPSPAQPLKIGTRGSPLALWQAHEVRRCLMAAFDLPEAAFAIVVIKVTGDQILDKALKEIGGKGLFTREIEEALLDGGIDIAVHSMKDMPTVQPEGLVLDCYLPREDVRDAFVSPGVARLADLPPEVAGLVADAVSEARAHGRLVWRYEQISSCSRCGKIAGHGKPRRRGGRAKRLHMLGVELAVRFVVVPRG